MRAKAFAILHAAYAIQISEIIRNEKKKTKRNENKPCHLYAHSRSHIRSYLYIWVEFQVAENPQFSIITQRLANKHLFLNTCIKVYCAIFRNNPYPFILYTALVYPAIHCTHTLYVRICPLEN